MIKRQSSILVYMSFASDLMKTEMWQDLLKFLKETNMQKPVPKLEHQTSKSIFDFRKYEKQKLKNATKWVWGEGTATPEVEELRWR